MTENEKRYSAPGTFTVFERDGWYLYYDPECFTYTRVNEHGKAILDAVGTNESAADISRKVASRLGFDPVTIEIPITAFLENMLSTGFIHEGPYSPKSQTTDSHEIKPSMLYLHPTFKCNMNCMYCYNKEDRKGSSAVELITEEWFDVLDQAKDMGVDTIIFTGGEPLLRKDLFDLAAYAKEKGMTAQLLTNGKLIDKNNIDRIVELFKSVGLSLDSHIEKTNDFLRTKGAYEKTLNAIRLISDRKHPYTIKAVITRYNVNDVPDLHTFILKTFKSGNINAGLYVPNSPDDTDLLPDLQTYRRVVAESTKIVEDYFGDDRRAMAQFFGFPRKQNQCGAATGEFAIGPDGSVYPCQALLSEEFYAGNIKEEKLADIYRNSPIMNKLRQCTADKIEICRDCEIKEICVGGCRSLAYNLFGTIDCHNAYSCEYLKDIATNVLWRASCIPIDELKQIQMEKEKEQEQEKEKTESAQA